MAEKEWGKYNHAIVCARNGMPVDIDLWKAIRFTECLV